jgi:hypothetical protein
MAIFAEINENQTVLRVLIVPPEHAHRGQAYLAEDLSLAGTWVETTMDGSVHGRYAGIGRVFDDLLLTFANTLSYSKLRFNDDDLVFDDQPLIYSAGV